MAPLHGFPCHYNDKGLMPLVPCLGFVGLAFAAIGFADLHLFGLAPSWVRVPREGIEPPRPKFQVYSLAQPTNSCLRGLARPHLSVNERLGAGCGSGTRAYCRLEVNPLPLAVSARLERATSPASMGRSTN